MIDWIFAIWSQFGFFLASRKIKWCWIIWLCTDTFFLIFFITLQVWSLVFIIYAPGICIDVQGIYKWIIKKDKNVS